MGLVSVAVRILNNEKKVGMDWTFIDLDYSSLSYREAVLKITSGEIQDCLIKEQLFPCKNLETLYGLASSSHKEVEKTRGGPDTDIIQKERRFSMLYFSIVCEHSSECSDCVEKSQMTMAHPQQKKNAFDLLMQFARANSQHEFPAVIENPGNKKDHL